ncbi:hypothetical protein [Nocardiopsis sp. CNR-923]|uniref:hypothetical protein n=1 Tax=Nocardiopsis sp. CNR-923 TaxID=1904965 RepID=UPI00117E5AE0|nr:hypothetical protein [Nocardiopsis sp. CNR-923]
MKKSTSSTLVFVSVIMVALISACEFTEEQSSEDDSPSSEASGGYVTKIWASATIYAYVLQEMFARDEDGSVMENIGDYYEERREFEEAAGLTYFDGMEILLSSGAIAEIDGGYRVAVDSDEWDLGSGSGVSESEVIQAMVLALEVNEVDWCGGSMNGYEFSELYLDSYWEDFDSHEEYVESIEEYVACGSGE